MTDLQCSVTNCVSNEKAMCCRNDIKVDGASAQSAYQTCCQNFAQRGTSLTNFVGTSRPKAATNVKCDVSNCYHNKGTHCDASSISVSGAGAVDMHGTECSSFRSKH